jgi:peptidoglycan/LPS O-acetylase OafA/YrhL
MKGGHPERLGAMALLAVFGISVFVPETRMWNVFLDDAAIDVGLALFFGWQAMNRDRWWPLVMTALMILTLLVHVAVFAAPSVGAYADVSARVGLGIAMAVTLLAGTAERWLAGERAVSGRSVWTRRSSPAYPRGSGGASSEGAAPFRPSS